MKFSWTVLLILILMVTGCRRKPPVTAEENPLTVEEWQKMPKEAKFSFETMERLKQGTPKFQDDSEWDRFARAVFIPARKRELPEEAVRH